MKELEVTLHKKCRFPLRISSSTGNCGFGYIYGRYLEWKTSFFVQSILIFTYLHVFTSALTA